MDERLTYRINKKGEAYLNYGLAAAWREMPRYDIIDNAIQKLADYEDMEQQNLLVKLPCPIGTKVYYVQKCCAPSCKDCLGYAIVKNCYTRYKARIFEQDFDYRHLAAFGETVFLTLEEAEQKLVEWQDEEDEKLRTKSN